MAQLSDETDTIEAFVALGGNADKTGSISAEKLSRLCKARAVQDLVRDSQNSHRLALSLPQAAYEVCL